MTPTWTELAAELEQASGLALSLEPLSTGRAAVLSPFTFDDGDRFPVVITEHDGAWQLSDEGGVALHLSYDDIAFDKGNRALLIAAIAQRHGLVVRDWELLRVVPRPLAAEDVLDFLHALARVNDVEFLARDVVASTFAEDVRRFFIARVSARAVGFDFVVADHDPQGRYKVDIAVRRGARPPLFIFAPGTDSKVKDATITLLKMQTWGVQHESMVVFEDQEQIGRSPLARLSDVVGKQFASLRGNEDRIARFLQEAGVPAPVS